MPERILVVDDEDSVVQTLAALLDREGYQTLTASSLDEALARVEDGRFDAVLLDLMLAGEDGLQVLAHLRASSPDTAAIILSGYGTLASATRAIQLGVSEYLTKPCPIDELKAALARGLARRRAILGARQEVEAERERLLAAERAARAEAERLASRNARLQQVTAALSRAASVADVGRVIAEQAVAATGANAGALGVVLDDGATMALAGAAGYSDEAGRQFAQFAIDAPLPMADAARAREPLWVRDHAEFSARYPHLTAPPERARIAVVPLLTGNRVVGAVSLSFPETREFTPPEQELILAVAGECARALERARLLTAEQEARSRATILAETSRLLVEASLNEQEVFATICRRVAEVVGDGCMISLRTPEGPGFSPVAIYHPDPEALALASEVARRPSGSTSTLAHRIVESGEPIVIPVVGPEQLATLVQPDRRAYTQRFGIHSLAIVPLRSRRETIGALTAWRDRPGKPYTDEDARLLQDLSGRAAIAIENARLYAGAREAIQLRDEFLSVAAHELKTPLTGLRGNTQLVLRLFNRTDAPDPERLRQRLTVIDVQAMKLTRLIEQLLDVSRLEAGRLALEAAPTDIATLIGNVVASAQMQTEQHTIAVHADGAAVATVDALRLEQVIANLLDNAVKYSPAGGSIDVAVTHPSADEVAISVTDRGIGIPPEHRAHIFDRFYQAHSDRRLGGMGLGLYVSRQIVELHGGSLEAEYPADGGTRFVVRLPVGGGAS